MGIQTIKLGKTFTAATLTAAITVTAFVTLAPADANDNCTLNGTGVQSDPAIITTTEELVAVADCNALGYEYFQLANHIYLDSPNFSGVELTENFFLNANGNTIAGLNVYELSQRDNAELGVALFLNEGTAEEIEISNLRVTGGNIYAPAEMMVAALLNTGGTISTNITNTHIEMASIDSRSVAAGFMAFNPASLTGTTTTIEDSSFIANRVSANQVAAGFIGTAFGMDQGSRSSVEIVNSQVFSDIALKDEIAFNGEIESDFGYAGGFVGSHVGDLTVLDSYFEGDVTITPDLGVGGGKTVGGIVGSVSQVLDDVPALRLQRVAVRAGLISSSGNIGGMAGEVFGKVIVNRGYVSGKLLTGLGPRNLLDPGPGFDDFPEYMGAIVGFSEPTADASGSSQRHYFEDVLADVEYLTGKDNSDVTINRFTHQEQDHEHVNSIFSAAKWDFAGDYQNIDFNDFFDASLTVATDLNDEDLATKAAYPFTVGTQNATEFQFWEICTENPTTAFLSIEPNRCTMNEVYYGIDPDVNNSSLPGLLEFQVGDEIDTLFDTVNTDAKLNHVVRYRSLQPLPKGIELHHRTGVISGTPLEAAPETSYTILAVSNFTSEAEQIERVLYATGLDSDEVPEVDVIRFSVAAADTDPEPQSPPSSGSSVASYTGPVLQQISTKELSTSGNELITLSGFNMTNASYALIGGTRVEFSSKTATTITLLSPAKDPGPADLVLYSNSTPINLKAAFSYLAVDSLESADSVLAVVKRISDVNAKVYARNIVGAGKIQFLLNGEEIAWIRAESATDPKLKESQFGPYLVRTINLAPGRNVVEIQLDGTNLRRVIYNR